MIDDQDNIVKDLVEVTFPEKEDFLKIRETLSRIGVFLVKIKNSSNHVIYFTNVVSII